MKKIKTFYSKLTRNQKIIGVIILVIMFLFYWYQLRPAQIKSSCFTQSREQAISLVKKKFKLDPSDEILGKAAGNNMFLTADYDNYFKRCLQEKGL